MVRGKKDNVQHDLYFGERYNSVEWVAFKVYGVIETREKKQSSIKTGE